MTVTKQATNNLTPERDINGHTLAVGTSVRSFDFPLLLDDGKVLGLDTEGPRVCYVQGSIEAIGEDVLEGCPRYRIKVDFQAHSDGTEIRRIYPDAVEPAAMIYPPVNGTPIMARDYACFGVVAIHDS